VKLYFAYNKSTKPTPKNGAACFKRYTQEGHGMNKLIIVIAAIIASKSVYAADILTVKCEEPAGLRYDYVNGAFKKDSDGFTGVNPQFIYSKNNPKYLTVIWPDTNKLGEFAKQQTHEAILVKNNADMISAISVSDGLRVDLYSLFPKQGVVLHSVQRNMFNGEIPNVSMFKMMCKFEAS